MATASMSLVAAAALLGFSVDVQAQQPANGSPLAQVGQPMQWTEGDPGALRAAVEDLSASFPRRYARGPEFLARLRGVEALLASADTTPARVDRAKEALIASRRGALLANPLVRERPILFVTRRQYRDDHHDTATLFQTGEVNTIKFEGGSALKCIDLGAGGKVTTLADRTKKLRFRTNPEPATHAPPAAARSEAPPPSPPLIRAFRPVSRPAARPRHHRDPTPAV